MNKSGVVLVVVLLVVLVMSVLGGAMFMRNQTQVRMALRHVDNIQSFWLAEAGVNQALINLRGGNFANIPDTSFGPGGYSVVIGTDISGYRTITSTGFVPFSGVRRSTRIIEAVIYKYNMTPANFYDNALYTAGNVSINGTSYSIDGKVSFGGSITDTSNISGGATNDAVTPLPRLSFDQLRQISILQGNYHDSTQLNGPFPVSFWHSPGVPNVIFLEGNLTMKGNISAGGFFVVGGEVVYDATISGNVGIDGAIYTRGRFTINGGGNALNVDGGVWSSNTTLNGAVEIEYNQEYMNAIRNLNIDTDFQISSWKDTQSLHPVIP